MPTDSLPSAGIRLLLHWADDIDSDFRRAFERALGDLSIAAADSAAIDTDPDSRPPVNLALVSASGMAVTGEADIVVLAGPGEFAKTPGALRLETTDITDRSRRWMSLERMLADKLARPSLGRALEDIAPLLDQERQRADQAERDRATFERERNAAIQAATAASAALAAEHAKLEATERRAAMAGDAVYGLAQVPQHERAVVSTARDHAALARIAAARAIEAAKTYPDALAWPKQRGAYSGETQNGFPHGLGELVLADADGTQSTYRGQFVNGARHGHGVAMETDGFIWCGQWRQGEAIGFGLLESPDGRRFEGETTPDLDGAPRRLAGYTWDRHGEAPARKAPQPKPDIHAPRPPLLPAPEERATSV